MASELPPQIGAGHCGVAEQVTRSWYSSSCAISIWELSTRTYQQGLAEVQPGLLDPPCVPDIEPKVVCTCVEHDGLRLPHEGPLHEQQHNQACHSVADCSWEDPGCAALCSWELQMDWLSRVRTSR